MRDSVNLSEFHAALKILNDKSPSSFESPASKTALFNVARDRITIFILYFSGLRVGNILNFTMGDIDNFLMHGSDSPTRVPLIKSRDKVVEQSLFLAKAVSNKYVFGEYNLKKDFETVQEVIFEAIQKNSPELEESILLAQLAKNLFYTSYKTPLKVASRVTLNNNVNKILQKASESQSSSKKTRLLTSHSFPINMFTILIENYGYAYAQKYAAHANIKTTTLYDRSIFDVAKLKAVSGILAQTRTGKTKKQKNEEQHDATIQQAIDLSEK